MMLQPKEMIMQVQVAEMTDTVRGTARWAAVLARDARADGRFVYAVRTTGIYCRPSCSSRRPKRVNVAFYSSPAMATAAGFRACKRCTPDSQSPATRHIEQIAKACRRIERADSQLPLALLAREAHLSTYHFHRLFKAITGLTPKQYAIAHRAGKVQRLLKEGRSVTDAMFDAGFNSASRFYEQADGILGMAPGKFRALGADERIRFAVAQCSLGAILVAASERGICAVTMGEDPAQLVRELQDKFARASLIGADRAFETLIAQVVSLVERPGQQIDLPLDVRGTVFQRKVWQALRKVPVGSTATYAGIARLVGAPASSRAVAQACGANPLAVIIPCHRVVRTDGALSGYRWGIERKRTLLQREGVKVP
jgi:AraC family transcriptional regulator of adaptative response/methylated-DNA-[protein]-cysteine methyltransferase